jgi:catechol 2,3-dioxygenase-like lactoylglutathione lyase family enzyme
VTLDTDLQAVGPGQVQSTGDFMFQVGIITRDSSRLQNFYCGVLGLPKGPDTQLPDGGIMRSCMCGTTLLKFNEPKRQPSSDAPGGLHREATGLRYLTFIVHNARQVHSDLVAAGYEIPVEITENDRRIMFFVQDPDGNNIEIGQDKSNPV